MPFVIKYLKGFIKFQLNHLIAGSKGESARISKYYSLKTAVLKNKKLAVELENACRKSGKALTFAEYLTIDQFGTNGFHQNNRYHGEQSHYRYWAQALAKYCIDNEIFNIVDFGPGNGDLAVNTLKYALKYNKILYWNGIEINKDSRNQITKKFKKENLTAQLLYLNSALDDLPLEKKSMIIFSFSLDNLAPEMLINTTKSFSFPNAVIGISIAQNTIKEIIFTKEQLLKKGISLQNGVFTDNKGQKFDITAWKLKSFQRACIPLPAVATLAFFTKHLLKDSVVVIIDEFAPNPYYAYSNHLNMPKDLLAYYRSFEDLSDLYKTSGKNLLYFPTYKDSYLKALHSLGYSNINIDLEQNMANKLQKNKIVRSSGGLCFAITGTKKHPIKFPVVIGAYK